MFYYQKKGIPSENPFLFRKELFKIFSNQSNISVKYFADIRCGMFLVQIDRQKKEYSPKYKCCKILKMT